MIVLSDLGTRVPWWMIIPSTPVRLQFWNFFLYWQIIMPYNKSSWFQAEDKILLAHMQWHQSKSLL